ncbi:hypothetical protein Tco_0387114 [Tanacetum coccineum]
MRLPMRSMYIHSPMIHYSVVELCTNLSQRVLDLENTKTSQAAEITKLKERVKKLERRNKSRTLGLKRLRKVGRSAQVVSSKDKGLGDQEDASKQERKIADLDVDARLLWLMRLRGGMDNVQAMIDADYKLAARLHAQEQEELTVEEKSKLFVELMDKRKKHFARLRSKEKDEANVTRVEESSSKRACTELEQERIKKQKIDDDQEEAEMKKHMEIVVDEEEIAY